MRIERFQCFLSVVNTGSFSSAAEQLYTTQSAVSKQILALERELGVVLFDRTHRQVELTSYGQIIYKHAQRLVRDSQQMYDELNEIRGRMEDKVFLATIPVMQQYGITELIGRFQKDHPMIRLNVVEMEGAEVFSNLEQRKFDLAFVRLERYQLADYDVLPYAQDRLMVLLPEKHPLSCLECIPLERLKDEDFLLLNEGTLLHGTCIHACRQCGFEPQIAYTGTRNENIAELVAMGMGVSLVMEQFYFHVKPKGVCCVPLETPIVSTIGFVRHRSKDYPSAVQILWNYVKKMIR